MTLLYILIYFVLPLVVIIALNILIEFDKKALIEFKLYYSGRKNCNFGCYTFYEIKETEPFYRWYQFKTLKYKCSACNTIVTGHRYDDMRYNKNYQSIGKNTKA